jgi:hypothetical protein
MDKERGSLNESSGLPSAMEVTHTRSRANGDGRSAANGVRSMKGNPAAIGSKATLEGASVSSERRAQALISLLTIRTSGRSSQGSDDFRTRHGLVRAKTRTAARR